MAMPPMFVFVRDLVAEAVEYFMLSTVLFLLVGALLLPVCSSLVRLSALRIFSVRETLIC